MHVVYASGPILISRESCIISANCVELSYSPEVPPACEHCRAPTGCLLVAGQAAQDTTMHGPTFRKIIKMNSRIYRTSQMLMHLIKFTLEYLGKSNIRIYWLRSSCNVNVQHPQVLLYYYEYFIIVIKDASKRNRLSQRIYRSKC